MERPVARLPGFAACASLALLGLSLLLSPVVRPHAAAQTSVTPKLSGSAIALIPAGDLLLAVNPDSSTLTVIDAAQGLPLAEIAVGVEPRSVAVSPAGERAFVANFGSDTVSVVDLNALAAIRTLPVGDRPAGAAVSADGRFLAVTEMGADQVRLVDAVSLDTLSVAAVGDRPYGLSFTPDGRRVLVTHLLSGQVTLLDIRPVTLYLPLIIGSASVQQAVLSGPQAPGRPAAAPARAVALAVRTRIPTWPNVAPAAAVVVNASGSRAYLAQTMANGLGSNAQFDTTVFPKVAVIDLLHDAHLTTEHISLPETDRPVGLPWDVALARNDTELWVVNSASNDVSVINISNPFVPVRVANISVGDNPRGIVLSPDGRTAYVNNVLAGAVSVIDARTYQVTGVITTTMLPLPPALLNGKRLYFSSTRPDLAQARWISCNTCHVEGEHDGRTWKLRYLGDVPLGAAPVITRNTTSLLGMIETYPLRWSAEWDESADSEFSVRFEQYGLGLIAGDMHPTLGPPNQGRSYDLDCLALYIDGLAVPAGAHALTEAAQQGRAIFESAETRCAVCHPAPLYTDLQVHDVGTAAGPGEWFGPAIDTPTLRFLYDSAPYLHDGRAATLVDVLTVANPTDRHGKTSHLTQDQLADLAVFLLSLPYNGTGDLP